VSRAFTESIVEDAALAWLASLGYAVLHGPHERSEERQGYRNGTRVRTLYTRVGPVSLQVPQARRWQFRNRYLQALPTRGAGLGAGAHGKGGERLSPRKVTHLTEERCGASFSKATVSALCTALDPRVRAFHERRLEGNRYPFLILDARLLKGADQSIKAYGNPSAKTILAGMPFSAVDPSDFLRGMFRADPKIYHFFQAAALHPYARTPSYAVDYGVRPFRRTLGQLLPSGVYRGLWITEIAWATGPPDGRFQVSRSTQASYLQSFYNKLLAIRKTHRINGVIWYGLQDFDDESWWAERTGLIERSGTNKPSWYRLKCVTGAPTSAIC